MLVVECVFAELMQGTREKRESEIISDYWHHLPKNSMDGIFFKAGKKSGRSKWLIKSVGLIDCAILMYARETKSQVWTLDKNLLSISILTKKERFS